MGEGAAEIVVLDPADKGRAPPRLASPTMVLAAEPPEISTAGPIAS